MTKESVWSVKMTELLKPLKSVKMSKSGMSKSHKWLDVLYSISIVMYFAKLNNSRALSHLPIQTCVLIVILCLIGRVHCFKFKTKYGNYYDQIALPQSSMQECPFHRSPFLPPFLIPPIPPALLPKSPNGCCPNTTRMMALVRRERYEMFIVRMMRVLTKFMVDFFYTGKHSLSMHLLIINNIFYVRS